MKLLRYACILMALTFITTTAMAQVTVLFQDDFESYANNAALTAAYQENTMTLGGSGLYTGPNQFTRGNQSVFIHSTETGRLSNYWAPAVSTATNKLTFSYWVYDVSGGGVGDLFGRSGITLASYTGGMWNTGTLDNLIAYCPMHTPVGGAGLVFNTRTLYGSQGADPYKKTLAARGVGWHKLTMVLFQGVVKFYYGDNLQDPVGQDTYTEPATGWNSFRLGSIAGAAYTDFYYDDILVTSEPYTWPAPTTSKKYWDEPKAQGVSTVGVGGDYLTLGAAAADFNTTAPLGNWTLEIISNIVEPAAVNFFQETNGHTITIKPRASNPDPVVVFFPNVSGGAEWGGSLVIGAHNTLTTVRPKKMDGFTIDGSKDGLGKRDLILAQGGGSTASSHVIVLVGDSDNVQFKNIIVTNASTSGSGRYGIRTVGVGWTGPPVEYLMPDNGLIDNCIISSFQGGSGQAVSQEAGYITGHPTPPAGNAIRGWVIRNNIITGRTRGLFLYATAGAEIYNNEIRIRQAASGTDSYGIGQHSANGAANWTLWIYNNVFTELVSANSSAGAFGMTAINISGGPSSGTASVTYNVFNNIIRGWRFSATTANSILYRGIASTQSSASTFNIYNNSITMPNFANLTGLNPGGCMGIGLTGAMVSPGKQNIKNNIINVQQVGGGAITRGSTVGLNSNNNNLYCAATAFTGRIAAADYASLGDWQTASGGDADSKALDPSAVWVSGTDLHFNGDPGAAWKFGASVAGLVGLNKDYDGDDRDVIQPYVGADEPVSPDTTLTIVSAYGIPVPAVGVYNSTSGTLVNASVASPVAGAAGTRYVCTGFTGTGSAPASGTDPFVSFTITDPASITWTWKTQYQLTTAADPAAGGSVSGADWYDVDASAPVEATENTFYTFTGWSGDLSGAVNPTNVTMDAPKAVTANFSTPELNVPVVAHNFGDELVIGAGGAASDFDFAIQNVGSPALDVNIFKAAGSDDFAIVPPAPATIAAGTTDTLKIRYTPETVGPVNATFKVVTQNSALPSTVTLTVSGLGVQLTAVVGGHPALGEWVPANAPIMDAAAGLYTLTIDIPTTPTEWKILKDKNAGWGGGNDIGRQADGGNMPDAGTTGPITYFYDTRDLGGDGWMPAAEGLGSTALKNIPWAVAGAFQGWDADSAVTVMNDDGLNGDAVAGDGIFTYQFRPEAQLTDSEFVIVSNLGVGWDGEYKFGENGMARDPGGVVQPKLTAGRDKEVTIEFDVLLGRMRVSMVTKPPLAVNDWSMY